MDEARITVEPPPKGWYVEQGELLSGLIAVVHRAECNECREGTVPLDPDGKWFGPFRTEREAIQYAWSLPGVSVRVSCRCTGRPIRAGA